MSDEVCRLSTEHILTDLTKKHEKCVLSIIMIIFQITPAVQLLNQVTAFPHNTEYQHSIMKEI